jgi:hypothetical protein
MADPEISRFPHKERPYMPGSQTTPGQTGARNNAPADFAFRQVNNVGTRIDNGFAAQWLAYTLPYRRFADILAEACARLGADVVRYSFIAVDLHHLLLAGLPAHLCENPLRVECDEMSSLQIALEAIFSTSPRVKRPPRFLSGGVFTQARPLAAMSAVCSDAAEPHSGTRVRSFQTSKCSDPRR